MSIETAYQEKADPSTQYPPFRLKIILSTVAIVYFSVFIHEMLSLYILSQLFGTFNLKSFIFHFLTIGLVAITPPVIVIIISILIFLNPLHKILQSISSGKKPLDTEYNLARKVIIRFPWLIMVLNVGGFLTGNIISRIGQLSYFLTLEGFINLLFQLITGILFAFIIIGNNNIILSKPRALLKIYYLDEKPDKKMSHLHSSFFTFFLAAYLMLSVVVTAHLIMKKNILYTDLLESVALKEKTVEQAEQEYMAYISNIPTLNIYSEAIVFPLFDEMKTKDDFLPIFISIFPFLLILAFFFQFASSRAKSCQVRLLKQRIKEMGENVSSCDVRVEITQFDEIGELTDKINRLMDKLEDRNRNEKKLREEKEAGELRLALAQKIAHIGSWETELGTNKYNYSKEFYHLLGLDPEKKPPDIGTLTDLIHPEDKPRWKKCINDLLTENKNFSIDIRAILNDESERFFHQRGEVQFDEHQKPFKVYGTIHDITDRKHAEQELMAKESALKAAGKAKRMQDEFLSSMSHELRSPLTSVIGFAERIPRKIEQNQLEKANLFAGNISKSATHLLEIINDLLDFSKIEAGKMSLNKERFQFSSVMDQIISHVEYLVGEKGVSLNVDASGEMPLITADRTRFTQILLNLVSNAVKFTNPGGTITIRTSVHKKELVFSVEDTGVGIAPEDKDSVFDRFKQVGRNIHEQQGTGLGLAITERLVNMQGGRIWVESEVNKGSVFSFTLPAGEGIT